MPKITEDQLNEIRYVSMADFCKRIDAIPDMESKRLFATRYLLSYGMNGAPTDYSFKEVMHIARIKIGDASYKLKEQYEENESIDKSKYWYEQDKGMVDPYTINRRDDLGSQAFMGNLPHYLKYYAEEEVDRRENINENEIGYQASFKQNCRNIASRLNDYDKEYADLYDLDISTNARNALDIKVRMETKAGSREAFNKAYKATKPGFWSRAFNTSSLEYQNLDKMWQAFNNPNHAMYGDTIGLDKAANEYLKHKFPDWEEGKEITQEMLSHLDKTEKARVDFCLNIKKSMLEEEQMIDDFETVIFSARDRNPNFAYDDYQENKSLDESEESIEVEEQKEEVKEDDFTKGLKAELEKADKDNALDELKDNEEMVLDDEEFVQKEDPDEEIYAVDDEDPRVEEFVQKSDELGESFLDTENIKKAEAEEERIKAYNEQQHLAEQLRTDLEMDENVDVDVEPQRQEYVERQKYLHGDDYEVNFDDD